MAVSLWATATQVWSAPWGDMDHGLLDQISETDSPSISVNVGTGGAIDGVATMGQSPESAAASSAPPSGTPGPSTTFHLCAGSDPQLEQQIEQAVAGRPFSATLVGRPDGCGDLTIT